MRNPKKVSNIEKINELNQSLYYNTEALDFVQNEIFKYENLYKYNEEDNCVLNTLNILRYIQFSLKYLDDTYSKSLILLEACDD